MGVDIETYRGRIGTFRVVQGIDVVTIICNVNFNGGIKGVGSVLFIGLLLLIAGIESNPGPGNNEPENQDEDRRKISVTGIPQGVDTEYLHLFFKNQKKQGGGKINTIAFDEANRSAVILFEEQAAVQIVLQKRPIQIKDTVIDINPMGADVTSCQSEQLCSLSTIEVTGFPMDDSVEDLLELYFNDEESSGGDNVTEVKIIEDGKAFVTFESATVAQRVISRKDHTLRSNALTIVAYNADSSAYCDSSTVSMEISSAQLDNTTKENEAGVSVDAVQIKIEETEESSTNNEHDALDNADKSKVEKEKTQDKTTINTPNLPDKADKSKDDDILHEILQSVGLTDKYPGKITLQDILSIDLDVNDMHHRTNEELPWVLLRRIIAVQSKARDSSTVYSNTKWNRQTDDIENEDIFDCLQIDNNASDSKRLSPFDIFLLTIQCCDPMLKELLFKKLYLCKIALPFVQHYRLSGKWEASVWPFRSLVIESNVTAPTATETEMLNLPVKTVTFANFGRPDFSKSKLLNDILSDEIQDTFFNVNCHDGKLQRYISNGTTEMFTLTSVGGKRDTYEEAVTFFNMRGDIKRDFPDNVINFMSKISDTLVLVIDKKHFEIHDKTLIEIVSRFSCVVLMVASPMDVSTYENIRVLFDKSLSGDRLKVLSSHHEMIQNTPKEIVQQLERVLIKFFKTKTSRSLEDRISAESNLSTDENQTECVKGKETAFMIFKLINSTGSSSVWKKAITPVHFIHSKTLGKNIKRLYRLKNINDTGEVEQAIKQECLKQLQVISEPVKLFIGSVNECIDSSCCTNYLLRWLSIFLDRQKRQVVTHLISENQKHREILEDLRNKTPTDSLKIKEQQTLVEKSQERIEDATLGIEHLFREIGHIYEAINVLNKRAEDFGLPSFQSVVNSIALLVTEGHTFELIDGDNFYLPYHWVKSVLEQISIIIKQKQVLAMSVLGIQSSGKSTLLNSMFGSQFPVKSGRCTRGIHMQLLPILSSNDLPFSYVLVIDSEGLKATRTQNHDNELSTVITGLGDVTLLNIMGENTSEIRDIIQVVVHAFLRLKLVNKTIDFGKSFYLVHQNVMDMSARDHMRTGLHALMETLDGATKDAAETEGIRDVTTFRQVIEFDLKSNVWYLPNFWQGNQPMVRVNSEYSDRLSDLKQKLLRKAFSCEEKSYKSLSNIAVQMQDIWKGVLTEDFVFRFRNSLEIKAYIGLEVALKDTLITFENEIEREHIEYSQNLFSECSHHDLQNATDKIIKRMRDALTENESVAVKEMEQYFDENEYKDIILQWKEFAVIRVKSLREELEDRIKTETMRMRDRKRVYIRIKEGSLKHENELYERCLMVAKEKKGECLNMEEIENTFEETWETVNTKIFNFRILRNTPDSLFDSFLKCLFDIFNTEKLILKTELERHGLFQSSVDSDDAQVPCTVVDMKTLRILTGSFSCIGIDLEDINMSSKMLRKQDTSTLSLVENVVDTFFETTDSIINNCLSENEEVTYREVRYFLQKSYKGINHMQQENTDFFFKITGIVKLFVHISSYAQKRFEDHNANYQRQKGIPARLLKYKLQVKEQFVSYLKDRKAEETAAKHITLIVENVLWDRMCERLQRDIKAALMQYLPHLKFHLILEIMEDMANNDDFESFITYIQNPRKFSKHWMKEKSEKYLFDPQSMKYLELASATVDEFYNDIKVSMEKSCSSFKAESPTIEKWIESFTTHLSRFSISRSEFQDILKDLKQVDDMKNFRSNLVEYLNESAGKAKNEFESKGRELVKFSGHDSPLRILFNKAWGCPEQCAYCGEPCAKGFSNHSGANHYSLQHRITCCSGTREVYTRKAVISSCNYNIQSFQDHHCDVFDFRCNQGTRKPCSKEWHKFSEYKQYMPDWDIEPNSNLQDFSKFWMWFVAKYKQKLSDHYHYDTYDIPSTWDTITKEDAFANLRRSYNV